MKVSYSNLHPGGKNHLCLLHLSPLFAGGCSKSTSTTRHLFFARCFFCGFGFLGALWCRGPWTGSCGILESHSPHLKWGPWYPNDTMLLIESFTIVTWFALWRHLIAPTWKDLLATCAVQLLKDSRWIHRCWASPHQRTRPTIHAVCAGHFAAVDCVFVHQSRWWQQDSNDAA